MTEIKLNLPRPPQTALALVQFDNPASALTTTPVILQTEPSAVELLETSSHYVPRSAGICPAFAHFH
ncbi:MAG: hypothetical protein U0401_03340 [Anaerolineae bacterium]